MSALELETGLLGHRLEEVRVGGISVNRAVYAARSTTPDHFHPHGDLCVTLVG
ncbi:MAG: hypothetical protein GY711_26915 [bacterium]|nr:hypothetical protein [bacterium]